MISLIAEILGTIELWRPKDTGNGIWTALKFFSIFFIGYTVTCLIYIMLLNERIKTEFVSRMRILMFLFAAILFIPLLYPVSEFMAEKGLASDFKSMLWWKIVILCAILYFHIIGFVVILQRDFKRLMEIE